MFRNKKYIYFISYVYSCSREYNFLPKDKDDMEIIDSVGNCYVSTQKKINSLEMMKLVENSIEQDIKDSCRIESAKSLNIRIIFFKRLKKMGMVPCYLNVQTEIH